MTDPIEDLTEDETLEAEVVRYPEWADEDEQRRAFILEYMGNAEIDVTVLVAAMAAIEKYLKTGEAPEAPRKPKFKAVPGKEP